ncbi:MAG TPA: hypothetical protein VG184_09655 [Acidimicrobiales bacterium]|nr:hypothetical protein [Acidimicrobiales bacterium]
MALLPFGFTGALSRALAAITVAAGLAAIPVTAAASPLRATAASLTGPAAAGAVAGSPAGNAGPAAAGATEPSGAEAPAPAGGGATAPTGTGVRAASLPGSGVGYWTVASDGGVYSFGTANLGEMRGQPLSRPIVAMAATPDGKGYWLVASDGGIFTFGDAGFYGSEGGHPLSAPVVGMAATRDGGGYWLVASDGGIFTFGDAGFYGSEGGHPLNAPVVAMAATSDGGGYWLVASDGGIFTFGDAGFLGSEGGHHLNAPIETMAPTPDGGGYWLVASDGGVFTFGDAPFLGSTGSNPGPAPIVDMASTAHGFAFPGGATGYDISWPQCGGSYPLSGSRIAVVGVTNGWIGVNDPFGGQYGPNPCTASEAAWAGPALQAYQVATPINGAYGDLANATRGPRYCPTVAITTACGYNWGWNNALQAVSYLHHEGFFPNVWWMDVETGEGWDFSTTGVNAQIIQGMVDAVRSDGLTAGVYCTHYQWGKIAGGYQMPGLPTWIAGAGNIYTGSYSASAFCSQSQFDFAGGIPMLVQYGYVGSGYSGAAQQWDPDYSCPR